MTLSPAATNAVNELSVFHSRYRSTANLDARVRRLRCHRYELRPHEGRVECPRNLCQVL
jgi:hypothetical protein